MPDDDWAPLRAELAADVRRVSDRLRNLSQAPACRPPVPPFPSRAAASREAARVLADAAQGIEAPRPTRPSRPGGSLPELADFAVGDQVAVTGHDLLAALDGLDPAETVWATGRPGGRPATWSPRRPRTLAATRRLL